MATDPESYRNGPAPPHLRETPTLRHLWRRMHVNNKNMMVCVVGEPGSGKSWAALRLAELLDPGFSAENVTFTPEEMLERIQGRHPTGDITVADEAGVSMNAKTWWESDQIQIENILETWRHENRGLIFTLPVFDKLQKGARGLIDVLLTSYGVDRRNGTSTWRFQLIETDAVSGEIYRPYPRLPAPETGVKTKYDRLELVRPSPGLREEYQAKKDEYTENLNEEALESVREDETDEDLDPREVAAEIAEEGVGPYLSEHGNTGDPYINKDLIRVDYDLSHSDADAVKSLLDRQIDLEATAV